MHAATRPAQQSRRQNRRDRFSFAGCHLRARTIGHDEPADDLLRVERKPQHTPDDLACHRKGLVDRCISVFAKQNSLPCLNDGIIQVRITEIAQRIRPSHDRIGPLGAVIPELTVRVSAAEPRAEHIGSGRWGCTLDVPGKVRPEPA